MLGDRKTRTCHKEPIEFSIYPVYQLLTRHTEKRNTRGARKSSRLCARGFVSPYPDEGVSRKENENFVGQEGETSRKRSLDRLAFGRRNFETDSENRRKWLDFFHGRRIRGRVERQIEFGRSFCRSARFNSRRTSRWAWGDEETSECEISVGRHEELGTRFLRFFPFRGMFFNDRSPQNTSWLLTIKTSKGKHYDLIRVNKCDEMEKIIIISRHI